MHEPNESAESIETFDKVTTVDICDNTSNLLGKGVFIHIVEDPDIPVNDSIERSAVLISVPATTNSAANVQSISALEIQDEVFSTAQVTVSVQYLACIPDDKTTFFTNLCSAMDVRISEDSDCVTIQGTWNKILLTQETMRAYLSSWKQQQLARQAYESLSSKERTDEPMMDSGEDCGPQEQTEETPVAPRTSMRTRHQERLQKEKSQAHGRKKSQKAEEGERVPENKENEIHLSISMAEGAASGGVETPKLIILPSTSSEAIHMKGPKKNYEELAPFKFFCSMCSFKSKRESHYQRHLERHETVSNLYSCDTCNFTTIRLGHLRRHELTHSTNTLSCAFCRYQTDDERHLARHQRIKHQSTAESRDMGPVEVLSCNRCAYTTTKLYLFNRHLKVHDAGSKRELLDPRSFQCEQCSYKTIRKEHYLRHVNNVHQNRRPYLCDFCGKAFKRPDALKQHGITHAEVDPNVSVYRCSFCNKGCRSQAHLNEHLAVHSNVRSFLCEICGLSFKTRSVQRKHVLTIHKNPHAFSCHRCLKRFNTKYALRRHMKQHSWKDDEVEECSSLVMHTTDDTVSKSSTLTVQVSDEILASLPPGAVPLFSVMANAKSKEDKDIAEGDAAAEALSLQLRHIQDCLDSNPDTQQTSVGDQYLPSAQDSTSNLLYVATTFEQF